MPAEYSGDPSTSGKDAVRFLIHDTENLDGADAAPLLQDEEIDWLLTQNSNVYLAAANACETIASRFRAASTSKSVGGLSITYATRSDEFANQAKLLRLQAMNLDSSIPIPISTAQSIAEKEARASDPDLNLSGVSIGMHDNHGTGAYAG